MNTLTEKEQDKIQYGLLLLKTQEKLSKKFSQERFHTATAGALLNQSIQIPAMTYENLLALTGVVTQDPAQVEEMFWENGI